MYLNVFLVGTVHCCTRRMYLSNKTRQEFDVGDVYTYIYVVFFLPLPVCDVSTHNCHAEELVELSKHASTALLA